LRDVAAVSLHPFEGDNFIVQETPMKRPHIVEYALAHKIADGVYLVQAIDEEDADAATRAALCGKGHKKDPSPCRITTREALFAFARATAARKKQDGALAIRLANTRTR
jgi:predicted homoserine dehydrogenase-like protein